MEQKVNETKNVEGQNFSTEWYEKQNPTNKDGNELNGFTSILLWLFAVCQIFRSVIGIATGFVMIGLDSNAGALKILGSVLSVLIAVAIILIVNKKKYGIYAFFAIEIIHIILGGVIGGGTAYAFGRYTGIVLFQTILLSVLLCFKKNGKTGWKVIFGK